MREPLRLISSLRLDTIGGLLLSLATIVALVSANSSAHVVYTTVIDHRSVLAIGGRELVLTTVGVVNHGLMTVFFFAVGLEIRRELHDGELADARRAALPIAAALGGMIMPAAIYALAAPAGEATRGWGIPMATDIAFAIAALALLGDRVAPGLRVLLLALAIVDDVGSVLVIALWYPEAVVVRWLPLVAIGTVLALGMRRSGVLAWWAYLVPGFVSWLGLELSGIHPTMAGVVMGLLTPPSRCAALHERLHPWVMLVVMPVFAFVNAGVVLSWPVAEPRIAFGVLAGLLVGKPLGVVLGCVLAVRLRLARVTTAVGWRGIVVVGMLAAVGFTVSLFVADLALTTPQMIASAKVGVLAASSLAIVLGATLGRVLLRSRAG